MPPRVAHGLRTLKGALGRFQTTLSTRNRHGRIARSDKRVTHMSVLKAEFLKAHPAADGLPVHTIGQVNSSPSRRSGQMRRKCLAATMKKEMPNRFSPRSRTLEGFMLRLRTGIRTLFC